MKKTISLIYLLFLAIILVTCSVQEEQLTSSVQEEQLTRIDVQKVNKEGNYEDKIVIDDKEKIDLIKNSLENTKWSPNIQAQMERKEDVLVTFYYTIETNGTILFKNKYQHRIWLNETATIISSNQTEGYGTLDKENSQTLKKSLLN